MNLEWKWSENILIIELSKRKKAKDKRAKDMIRMFTKDAKQMAKGM